MKSFLVLLVLISGVTDATDALPERYTMDSDRQEILPNGNIKATGHVHVVSGDMTIDADEATYHREETGNIYVTATGSPIRYKGRTEDGKSFVGNSRKLKYIPDTGEVQLTGDAYVEQDGNTLSAEVITYNTLTKK